MIWSYFSFRVQPKPQQLGRVAGSLLEDGSALFSESYGVSGMFGTNAAQVCQRVSIIWLFLPFLFALVGAYFCPIWCASKCYRIAILQPQFRPEDVAAMQLNQHASQLWHFLTPGIAAAASFSRRHSCSCGFVRPWMEQRECNLWYV